MSWLYRKAEVIRNMAVNRDEIPAWLKPDLVSYQSGGHRDGVYYGLNQLVANGNFASGSTSPFSFDSDATLVSLVGAEVTFLPNAQYGRIKYDNFIVPVEGHKYYYRVWVKASSANVRAEMYVKSSPVVKNHSGSGQYELLSLVNIGGTGATIQINIVDTRLSGWANITAKYFMTYDLGDANSPLYNLTAAEIDSILSQDGTAYWDGTRNILCNPDGKYYWYDYSGNGRHMKMSNLAWTGTSNLDQYGFNVDGVDDYGSIADSVDTRLTAGGTLMAWIKPRTYGESNGRIFDKSSASPAVNGYAFLLADGGKIYAYINGGTALISYTNAYALNKSQLAVATFNASGRRIYINAVDVTESGSTETALPPDVAGVVAIGNRANATDRTFDGFIDKPRIIKRALTQAEIMQIFQNERRFYGV